MDELEFPEAMKDIIVRCIPPSSWTRVTPGRCDCLSGGMPARAQSRGRGAS
jgi:hypothetical protein